MNRHLDLIVTTPELDVVRIVSLKGDMVLLVKESDDENWKLPGGKIHAGETIFEAFQREVEEELGMHLNKDTIKNYIPANIPDSDNIRHIILVSTINDDSIIETQEVQEFGYYPINALPDTKFQKHILSAIKIITE